MKADRRTRRSREKLQQALIELLLEKSYTTISIRDITERANIGYATFFRHYDGMDALLADAFQQSVDQLLSVLQLLGDKKSPVKEGQVVFEHVAAHHDLYQVFLKGEGTQVLVDQIQREAVKELVMRFARSTSDMPAAILANHVVASIIALIKWWLRNDMPFSPERMGAIYADLIIRPVQQHLGASDSYVPPLNHGGAG